jgi:hypothetical protein
MQVIGCFVEKVLAVYGLLANLREGFAINNVVFVAGAVLGSVSIFVTCNTAQCATEEVGILLDRVSVCRVGVSNAALCSAEWATMMIMLMIINKAEILWKLLAVVYCTKILYLLEDKGRRLTTKCWYLPTSLHDVACQRTVICMVISVKTLKLTKY